MIGYWKILLNLEQKKYISILAAIFSLLAGLSFAALTPGAYLDGALFDHSAPLLGAPRPAPEILLILISEQDYKSKATPLALWSQHLMELLRHLAKADPQAVGLDLVLPQFRLARWVPGHDAELLRALDALKKQTRLVSGYGIEPDGRLLAPFPLFQKILGRDGLGYLNSFPDRDGILRSQPMSLPAKDRSKLKAFSALLAGNTASRLPARPMPDWRNPAIIERLGYQAALDSTPDKFAQRTIIIGFDFAFEDRHLTPAASAPEPGAVFQARLVHALKTGSFLIDPGYWISSLLPCLAAVIFFMLLTHRPAPARIWAAGSAGALVLVAADLAGLYYYGLVLRPAAGLVSLAVFAVLRWVQGYYLVRTVFGRYVSGQVRNHILSGRIPLDGEYLTASILFADLRGFTSLGEVLPAKQVVQMINLYFGRMSREIHEAGGLVLQYVGDEIMAIFGAPLPCPDHGERAVRAGMAMMRARQLVNQELAAKGLPPLRHGIGVHCGKVLAGNVGGAGRISYRLVGDPVNLASRIQGLNKEFGTEMLISAEVLNSLTEPPQNRAMPPVQVKGRAQAVQVYEVLNPKPDSPPTFS